MLNEFADDMKRRVVESAAEVGKKVVSGYAALGAGGDEVGGVGVNV